MPRDFKSFAKENENIIKENPKQTQEYEDILNKYKNMNNSQLMSSLFEEASKLEQQGKLDNNTLNSLKSTLAPFLNSDQQNLLSSLVDAINEQK